MIQEISQCFISEPLSCMDASKEVLAIGTLDENVYLFSQPFQQKKNEMKLQDHLLGVIDVCINKDETQIAVSSFDNFIRVWDIDDKQLVSEISCEAFSNWKVRFQDSSTIVTSGEAGVIHYYHIDTKERVQKIETDPTYYQCSLQINDGLLAVGNEGGSLFIIDENGQKKQIKVHSKAIKTLLFIENNKLLTGSEDGLIKLIDLEKQEISSQFRGHKYGVTDMCKINDQSFASCSTDRSIRVWDLSQIYSQKQVHASNDKPGGISGLRYNREQLIAAHDCGQICFYAV